MKGPLSADLGGPAGVVPVACFAAEPMKKVALPPPMRTGATSLKGLLDLAFRFTLGSGSGSGQGWGEGGVSVDEGWIPRWGSAKQRKRLL